MPDYVYELAITFAAPNDGAARRRSIAFAESLFVQDDVLMVQGEVPVEVKDETV